jgi:hypothetical protein
VQHRLERLRPDVRISHTGVGELADVGGNAVQVGEGPYSLDIREPSGNRTGWHDR